jgi:hypothetical protein
VSLAARMALSVETDVQCGAATAVGELAVVVCDASVAGVGSAVEARLPKHIAGFDRVGSSPHTGTVLVVVYMATRSARALGYRQIAMRHQHHAEQDERAALGVHHVGIAREKDIRRGLWLILQRVRRWLRAEAVVLLMVDGIVRVQVVQLRAQVLGKERPVWRLLDMLEVGVKSSQLLKR